MIKKVIYCIMVLLLTSCKQSGQNKAPSKIGEFPIGVSDLPQFNFPLSWKNLKNINDQDPKFKEKNISKKGYDSIFYFIHKNSTQFYNELIVDKKQKLSFIPKINDSINNNNQFYKIDSAYFVKSFNKGEIILKLYKDGNKYSKLIGDENTNVVNYLLLASFDKNEKLIDTNIIYYNTHGLYEYSARYFYIDESINIITKDFYVDEINTHYKGENKISLSKNGNFIFSENIANQSLHFSNYQNLNDIKKNYIKEPFIVNKEIDLDFNNDNKKDKLFALGLRDNNIDCNKEEGKQPLLILKNEEQGKYQVYYFGDSIFPSICSYGEADVYLDFNYEKGFIHFKSISKVENNMIINRDYYFNLQLKLDHITFSKSKIGEDKGFQKTVTKKDFGNIDIKDFKFENFKESRFGF